MTIGPMMAGNNRSHTTEDVDPWKPIRVFPGECKVEGLYPIRTRTERGKRSIALLECTNTLLTQWLLMSKENIKASLCGLCMFLRSASSNTILLSIGRSLITVKVYFMLETIHLGIDSCDLIVLAFLWATIVALNGLPLSSGWALLTLHRKLQWVGLLQCSSLTLRFWL